MAEHSNDLPQVVEDVRSLRASVEAIANGWGNLGRLSAVQERVRELGIAGVSRTEWIDWFTLQRNVLIEIPGQSRQLIYLVAHYDKTDVNPLTIASNLVNGLLDPLMWLFIYSSGAIDNATGVALALEVAAALQERSSHFTYRILLTGAEENGLRGSRAHMARLSKEELESITLAINIDTVGVTFSPNCITAGISDPEVQRRAIDVANDFGVELGIDQIPAGASSDFEPFATNSFWRDFGRGLKFNLVGGFLPQRSWFTSAHSARVVNFSSCDLVGASDYLAALVLLPFGTIHGPRDRASVVDVEKLHELYLVIVRLLEEIDGEGVSNEP